MLRSKLNYWKINWKKTHGIDWVRHCELLNVYKLNHWNKLYFDINNQIHSKGSCSGSLWYNMYLSYLYHYFVLILSRNGLLLCLGSVTAYIVILPHIFFKCKLCCPVSNQIQLKVFKYNKKKISQSYIRFLTLWGVYIFKCSMKSPCTDCLWWISLQVIYTGSDWPVPALQNNQRQVHQWHHQITGSCLATQPQVHKFICTEGLKILTFALHSWLGLSLLGFEHPPSPCEANALTHCATAAVSHIIGA